MARDLRILDGSPLTIPFRSGWTRGWSIAEVEQIIRGNEAAALVVSRAGGVEAWINATDGGRLDPELWPFEIPTWEEWTRLQRGLAVVPGESRGAILERLQRILSGEPPPVRIRPLIERVRRRWRF